MEEVDMMNRFEKHDYLFAKLRQSANGIDEHGTSILICGCLKLIEYIYQVG
jgi:hypothetical protein